MSDDELKAWAERQSEDPRSAAVMRLLAERDRLAAELAEQQQSLIAIASALFITGYEGDGVVNGVKWLAAELAELRAACRPFAECARSIDLYGKQIRIS